jgi:hypothetical protein
MLNKKTSSLSQDNTISRKITKVGVQTLEEAADLIQNREYRINPIGPSSQRALRQFSAVAI